MFSSLASEEPSVPLSPLIITERGRRKGEGGGEQISNQYIAVIAHIYVNPMLRKPSQKKIKLHFRLLHLCEARSFPEPEVAFADSPPLPEFPDIPLDFLAEARSFPSGPLPSNSAFVCTGFGVYRRNGKN